MKIAVLAHNLKVAGGRSVGLNIVKSLPAIAPDHEFLFTIPNDCGYPELSECSHVRVIVCPPGGFGVRWRWENGELRKRLDAFGPDWIWATGNVPVPDPPCRQSLLLQNAHRLYRDLSREGAGLKSRFFKWLSDRQLDRRMRYVDRLYCQTETMRQKAYRVLEYPLEQIGLCPNSFSTLIRDTTIWPNSLEPLRGRFILFVLTKYYIHKNLERIVEMFANHRRQLSDMVCLLPVSSDQGSDAARFVERIQWLGLEDQVRCVGGIPQEELGGYFAASDVMFLPTLLESFSGTYLEAMTFRVPIVTSDRDFAREICGDAAEYVDPLDVSNMSETLLGLKESPQRRQQLIDSGQARVHQFLRTWPDILRDVLDQEGIAHA